jgi:hypothetical protein
MTVYTVYEDNKIGGEVVADSAIVDLVLPVELRERMIAQVGFDPVESIGITFKVLTPKELTFTGGVIQFGTPLQTKIAWRYSFVKGPEVTSSAPGKFRFIATFRVEASKGDRYGQWLIPVEVDIATTEPIRERKLRPYSIEGTVTARLEEVED